MLTTHYMEEAAQFCDSVAVVDYGKVIALGTPRELIASLGAEHIIEFATGDSRKPQVYTSRSQSTASRTRIQDYR